MRKKGIENKKVRLMMFLTELIYFCKKKLDFSGAFIRNGWILLKRLGGTKECNAKRDCHERNTRKI